jgi:hypothetical protein
LPKRVVLTGNAEYARRMSQMFSTVVVRAI